MLKSFSATNLLHFIWFGRDLVSKEVPFTSRAKTFDAAGREIPCHGRGGNITRLVAWAEANPDYQVYLWTEKELFASIENELIARGKHTLRIKVIDFDHYPFRSKKIFRDLVSFFRFPPQETGIVRVPNYGAASDVSRGIILLELGGIYMDFDTKRLNSTLPFMQELILDSEVLLSLEIINPDDPLIDLRGLCNDVICCRAGSPIIEDYLNLYVKNFTEGIAIYGGMKYKDAITSTDNDFSTYATETLGPVLMRYCVLKDFLLENLAEISEKHGSKDPKKSGFEKSGLSHYLLPSFSRTIGDLEAISEDFEALIERMLFPRELYERGIDNGWKTPREPQLGSSSSLSPSTSSSTVSSINSSSFTPSKSNHSYSEDDPDYKEELNTLRKRAEYCREQGITECTAPQAMAKKKQAVAMASILPEVAPEEPSAKFSPSPGS